MESTTAYITETQRTKLRLLSEATGTSMAAFVRQGVDRVLQEAGLRGVHRNVCPNCGHSVPKALGPGLRAGIDLIKAEATTFKNNIEDPLIGNVPKAVELMKRSAFLYDGVAKFLEEKVEELGL